MPLKAAFATLLQPMAIRTLLLKERMRSGVAFNPLAASMRINPYPAYRRLLTKDPVHWSELLRGWVLTRYADVAAVYRDPRLINDRSEALEQWFGRSVDEVGPFMRIFSRSLLGIDPPDHTRLRALVSTAFTPRAVEALRPRIHEIVDQSLDAARARGQMDVVHDLAYPLPVIVIAELLGVPPEDRQRLKQWSDDLGEGLEPLRSPEAQKRIDRSSAEVLDYFRGIVQERRRQPREDLISALVAAGSDGDRLSEDELLATLVLLLAAGNETTTSLIGNAVLALLNHPDQLDWLHQNPDQIEPAVEELLRYDSPVQVGSRMANADVEIGGRTIRRGDLVVMLLGAANRDPEQFPDPDRLNLSRSDNRHLAFGVGIHYCLGAPLARIEGQIALGAIAERLHNLHLAGTPRWRETMVLHGLQSLPVAFDAG